ncbi:MAG: hypothetical protein MJ166_03665 [Clostridia bacterium]|nr:hypothetical protein [Clostridia bacterium]
MMEDNNNKITPLYPGLLDLYIEEVETKEKSNQTIWKRPTEEQQTIILRELNSGNILSRFFRKKSKFYKTIKSEDYLCCAGKLTDKYSKHLRHASFYYLEVSSETIKYTLKVSFSEYCKHGIGYVGHLIMICHNNKENEIKLV